MACERVLGHQMAVGVSLELLNGLPLKETSALKRGLRVLGLVRTPSRLKAHRMLTLVSLAEET